MYCEVQPTDEISAIIYEMKRIQCSCLLVKCYFICAFICEKVRKISGEGITG